MLGTWWPTTPAWIYGDPRYLVSPQSKLREILAPGNQPSTHVQWQGHGSLGAWRRSSQLGQTVPGAPVFYNAAGQTITSAVCGTAYGFNVPGYENSQVYIIQTKNGNPQYSGLFSVPMAPYTSTCNLEEGTYVAAAYDPTTGQSLGSTQFQVLPAGSQPGPAGPPVTVGPGSPIHATGTFNLNTTAILALAAAAYFILGRGRG